MVWGHHVMRHCMKGRRVRKAENHWGREMWRLYRTMVTSLHILAIKWVGFPGCGLVTGKRIPYTFFTVTWQVLVPVRCLRRFVENNAFCIIHTSWTEKKKCANQYSPCCILSTAVFFPASPRWFIENNADRNLRCWLHNSFMVCSWKNSVRDVTVKRKLMFCT